MINVKPYPKDNSYQALFEDVRVFILKLNESYTYINYHWSRWEWFMARNSFSLDDLHKMQLFYEHNELVGILMLEDSSDIYYYLATSINAKKSIVKHMYTLENAKLMIEERDIEMLDLIKNAGWIKTDYTEHIARLKKPSMPFQLPKCYELLCFKDDYDVSKHHACLWYGFNHGEGITFDEEILRERKRQIMSPHFKLKYAYVVAYQNQYVAFTSIWYEPNTNIAMLEPVCTVPEHRRKGLATATISKCIDAAKKDGAKEIIVGSNQDFYKAIGFEVFAYAHVYKKQS